MQVIRLCKYSMLRRLTWAIVLVALCLIPVLALADKPPQALFQAVTTTSQLVHRGECNIKSMNKEDVPCLIFYDAERDIVWLVLFDKNKDGVLAETHVIAIKDKKETVIWCRDNVCI